MNIPRVNLPSAKNAVTRDPKRPSKTFVTPVVADTTASMRVNAPCLAVDPSYLSRIGVASSTVQGIVQRSVQQKSCGNGVTKHANYIPFETETRL